MTNALVYNGIEVRRDEDFLNLTDMWKASGSDQSKKPANWIRKEGAPFIEFVAENQGVPHGHLLRKQPGNPQLGIGGATWAHWQIGFAYAKYLSPAFHAWCNEVVRAHIEGRQDHPIYDRILRHKETRANWELMWRKEVVDSIAPLYGKPEPGGQFPMWMRSLIGKLYDELFGKDVMGEARRRRGPHTGKGNLLTQYMQDDAKEFLRTHIDVVLALAKTSCSPEDFWAKVQSVFGRSMLQLPMFALDGACANCGQELEPSHRFCPGCGARSVTGGAHD
jgi:hypothetical protein